MIEYFNSPNGKKLNIKEVVSEIVNFIKEEDQFYRITIGTDSEISPDLVADFVTAIVIHRVGKGGRYFWRKIEGGKFYNLHDRIIKEVILSLEVGREILDEIKNLYEKNLLDLNTKLEFEIHIDVGENGETKSMIQEVIGMVRAYEFKPVTKPQSYAASNVADRHV